MNNIKNLIKNLKSNFDFIKINKVVNYIQPTKYIVSTTNYSDLYKTPVLTPGKSFILGYTNETNGIYDASKENPIILFDDFTCSFHWVDFPFKVKSSAVKILIPFDKNKINFKYIYFTMTKIKINISEHKRQWIQNFSNIPIPFPPLSIQNKIVEILDNFSNLVDNLNDGLSKEIELRQKQYKHYLNKLLSFK